MTKVPQISYPSLTYFSKAQAGCFANMSKQGWFRLDWEEWNIRLISRTWWKNRAPKDEKLVLGCVLSSYCGCNELPQIWWAKSIQGSYLRDPKSTVGLTELKSKCCWGCIPFWSFQEIINSLVLLRSWRLITLLDSWPPSIFKASNSIILISASVVTSPFLISSHPYHFQSYRKPNTRNFVFIIQDNLFT